MRRLITVGLTVLLAFCAHGRADTHEARIPLRDHKLRTADLSSALMQKLRLPGVGVSLMPGETGAPGVGVILLGLRAGVGNCCPGSPPVCPISAGTTRMAYCASVESAG